MHFLVFLFMVTFLKQALASLGTHQVYQEFQGVRIQVHTGCIGEVLVDVLKGTCCPEEVVHSGI